MEYINGNYVVHPHYINNSKYKLRKVKLVTISSITQGILAVIIIMIMKIKIMIIIITAIISNR